MLPSLWVEANDVAGGWKLSLGASPSFANVDYHDNHKGRAPEFATAQCSAYEGGGYSGASVLFGDSRRFKKIRLGTFVRYDNLASIVFDESSLFKTEHARSAGFTIARILARSEPLVEAED